MFWCCFCACVIVEANAVETVPGPTKLTVTAASLAGAAIDPARGTRIGADPRAMESTGIDDAAPDAGRTAIMAPVAWAPAPETALTRSAADSSAREVREVLGMGFG